MLLATITSETTQTYFTSSLIIRRTQVWSFADDFKIREKLLPFAVSQHKDTGCYGRHIYNPKTGNELRLAKLVILSNNPNPYFRSVGKKCQCRYIMGVTSRHPEWRQGTLLASPFWGFNYLCFKTFDSNRYAHVLSIADKVYKQHRCHTERRKWASL